MVEIELTHDIARQFIDMPMPDDFDIGYQPYTKFVLLFPFSVIVDKEKAIEENKIPANKVKDIEFIFNSFTRIEVDFSNDIFHYKLTNNTTKSYLDFDYHNFIPIPMIKKSNLQPSDMRIAKNIIKLSFMVSHHLTKPTTIVKQKMVRLQKNNQKKKKARYNNGKSYIYKTRYVFEKINDENDNGEKRSYKISKSSWTVSGHWRYYKSGKKVWVDSYKKGKKDNSVEKKKITRL